VVGQLESFLSDNVMTPILNVKIAHLIWDIPYLCASTLINFPVHIKFKLNPLQLYHYEECLS
jgi:hypothetical protein